MDAGEKRQVVDVGEGQATQMAEENKAYVVNFIR